MLDPQLSMETGTEHRQVQVAGTNTIYIWLQVGDYRGLGVQFGPAEGQWTFLTLTVLTEKVAMLLVSLLGIDKGRYVGIYYASTYQLGRAEVACNVRPY